VKAEIKSIFSWDVPDGDLEQWTPSEKDFGIYVMLFIGTEGDNRSDCFGLLLCTPSWFAKKIEENLIETGQYTLFVSEFNYVKIREYIDSYVRRFEADSWLELASKLDHLASWEFKTDNTYISSRGIAQRTQSWVPIDKRSP
jgi:hypothetical protein